LAVLQEVRECGNAFRRGAVNYVHSNRVQKLLDIPLDLILEKCMIAVSLAPVYQSAPTNASPWKYYGLLAEVTASNPRDWIVGVGGRWCWW
jgi:hypothetical protein